MVGDERVRLCGACDRQVFNLSEMTQEQAEAVMATRGIRPCVRFYRRTDGTVMTADCPTGARRACKLAVVAGAVAAGASLFGASPAMAEEPADDPTVDDGEWSMGDMAYNDVVVEAEMGIPVDDTPYQPHRPTIEWSTWFRLGFGTESSAPGAAARATTPTPTVDHHSTWEAALGADFSLPIANHGDLRLGAWAEARTSSGPVLGGELIVDAVPRHLDMFLFDGQGILALRAGGNGHVVTAAIAYGYLAPWKLFGPWNGATRYMIGVRLVASATRSLDDPRDWSAIAGLEVEPIGALRYLLGIRSWY
jgi:hypothetical protein